MIALSICQPWALLIALGIKNIENRNWPTEFRGTFYIHAGNKFDPDFLRHPVRFMNHLKETCGLDSDLYFDLLDFKKYSRRGIIGSAEITDCVAEHSSPWFFGPYGFTLQNAMQLPFKSCNSFSRFFDICLPSLLKFQDIDGVKSAVSVPYHEQKIQDLKGVRTCISSLP